MLTLEHVCFNLPHVGLPYCLERCYSCCNRRFSNFPSRRRGRRLSSKRTKQHTARWRTGVMAGDWRRQNRWSTSLPPQ